MTPSPTPSNAVIATSLYRIEVEDMNGKKVPLSKYRGNVLLIVNTASLCGNTPQYAALEQLYKTYSPRGFKILAFPANNFANQEPGGNGEIRQFCTAKYSVTFDLFSKLSVAGDDQAPLYRYLTDKTSDPKFGGPIEWNFAKFLVSRDGRIVARFPAGRSPSSPDVTDAIEAELTKPTGSAKPASVNPAG